MQVNCHDASSPRLGEADRKIAIVGNPNVGKSVIFGELTNKSVTVSNYPGTTVEVTSGRAAIHSKNCLVMDTPGANSFVPMSEDEEAARNILLNEGVDVVLQVIDSKNLGRGLMLTLQILEMGLPAVVALNMQDELASRGLSINRKRLEDIFGFPFIPATATQGEGTQRIKDALMNPGQSKLSIPYSPALERGIAKLEPILPESPLSKRSLALMVLSGDETLSSWLEGHADLRLIEKVRAETQEAFSKRLSLAIHEERQSFIEGWARQVYDESRVKESAARNLLEKLTTHRVGGVALVLAVLYTVFWFVGLFGAGTLVDFFETVVFGHYLNPWCIRLFAWLLPFPHVNAVETSSFALEIPVTSTFAVPTGIEFVREAITAEYVIPEGVSLTPFQAVSRFIYDFFVGEYGAVTMALSYGFAIVLPIVGSFFIVFSILEDSGYLPRLAIMVDRWFKLLGLNGKAVLPMLLGFGCDTMATMTARIMETRKERIIVTLLLALGIPCSAQLGVLLAMMASISLWGVVFWATAVGGVLLLVGFLSSRLLEGNSSDFILELPPLRVPIFGNILLKTVARLEWYLKEVIPLFVLGTAFLFFLDKLNLIAAIRDMGSPLVQGFLGLPAQATEAFLIGFLRRDYGAVYLLDAMNEGLLTHSQILVAMITITLFVPCIANVFVIAKERGTRVAVYMLLFIFPFAFLIGGLTNIFLKFFNLAHLV